MVFTILVQHIAENFRIVDRFRYFERGLLRSTTQTHDTNNGLRAYSRIDLRKENIYSAQTDDGNEEYQQ